MGKSCCAVGCTNRFKKGSSIHFYRFPDNLDRRAKWIAAVRRNHWAPNEHSWLCSEHFVSGEKSNDPLSPDYILTIFKHVSSPAKRKNRRSMQVREAVRGEKRKDEDNDRRAAADCLLALSEEGNGTNYCEPHTGVYCSTELTMAGVKEVETRCAELEQENRSLQVQYQILDVERRRVAVGCAEARSELEMKTKECSELIELNRTLTNTIKHHTLDELSLDGDNARVKYYTGLPHFSALMALFSFVSVHVPVKKTAVSNFQQFLLVLMKLRLNLGDQDLAYRFNVSQATVSRYFAKWVDIMYIRLKPLIKWPSREELLKTMPTEFRASFRKCVVIIDCFEIFIERPTSLMARAQTWSNYKHHNTVKYLIGICPQGAVTFISKGWGGRVSDVHLTENCHILENLLPGDVIIADRGFNVHDSAGIYCAEVKLPSFTRGKKQLSKAEVDSSRQLSRVRIHVERVIGAVRQKYTLLQSTLPINLIMCDSSDCISTIDKVVFVCCALFNCCDSIVLNE